MSTEEFTPFTLLWDVGWISLLMVIGNTLRRRVGIFQRLLMPASITGGILALILGPEVLGWIPFSDSMGTYTTLLIAFVFASMAYSMDLGGEVAKNSRSMWAYSTSMFLGQWGLFIVLGMYVLDPIFHTGQWFGMMLPVGFVGGFGTAAAVGSALQDVGASDAASLGFTSATVGTVAAIVGGMIFSAWGIRTGRTNVIPQRLPWDLRSGYIENLEDRPVVGHATTNPSAIEPITLHLAVVTVTVLAADLVVNFLKDTFPTVTVPLFAMSFVMGLAGRLFLKLVRHPYFLDKDLITANSGAATDYLIAFGVASIAPSVVAAYWQPLLIMFVVGILYCFLVFRVQAPQYFGERWLERGLFTWGWATAAVATGIALLKIVDPKLKSGTLNEYGVAYVGFAPFEIGMTLLAPMSFAFGWMAGLGWASVILGIIVAFLPKILDWEYVPPTIARE
ncbi:sodium/glutamate symporter [Corynebacterium pyruviciproducens]|uniref:sodium/glutamate symporter n=1 Tax=Corynebacterium pyruviciproducens TaxID=598660 RepID=UPI00288C151C|nr:sodium/glutamate symporter [Corynebacterium pyruviciproducens]